MAINFNRLNKDFSEEITLLASAQTYRDYSSPNSQVNSENTEKYSPLKNIVILNTGTEAIKIYFNDEAGYKLVPSGVTYSRNNLNIRKMRFENTSATTSAVFSVQLDNDFSAEELQVITAQLQLAGLRGV